MSPRRVFNFGAGPAMLPTPVLETVQAELLDFEGLGVSVMELSHGTASDGIDPDGTARVTQLRIAQPRTVHPPLPLRSSAAPPAAPAALSRCSLPL